MSLSEPFIRRPIGTTLLAIGLALSGIIAFKVLPVAPLPQIDFPTILVQALLPGGSPETMATSVASPLEHQLSRIAGISSMTSSSVLGQTNVIVQFELSRDIDGAARDVQAAINASLSQLPSNLTNNPTYRKVNPADAPIMILSLSSDIYTPAEVYDAASTILQQKLARIEGVGQVTVGGGSLPAVRVELNPTALNKYGIGLNDVASVIAAANTNHSKGHLQSDGSTLSTIYNNDQLFKAKEYAPLIITYHDNSPVRISDVGETVDSVVDVRNIGLANGKPAVLMVLFKQPGANVINTIEHVQQILPELKTYIPRAMSLKVIMDRTVTIRASLVDVEITLMFSLILVILVTYLFLGSIRAMLIPGVAVPLSILGTFGVMQLIGYSLDNLSLMALTISTGFVVDDAVVVLENISRHIENGVKPLKAALDGAKEIGFTVVSMSLSLIAVFIPILFMGSIVGRLFREFAVTLSVAILISLLVSLTVTPMMCAKMLHEEDSQKSNRFTRTSDRLQKYYTQSLQWALHHPSLMLFLTFATLVLTVFLFFIIPKGFFPQQDTGRIIASIQAEQDISFQVMEKKLLHFVNIVNEDQAVENVVAFAGNGSGPGSGNPGNSATMFIILKPLELRRISADGVITRLRDKLKVITGATLYMQSAQDITVGGRLGNAQFQYTISADNLDDLNSWTPKINTELAKLPYIADVNSDQLTHGLQTFVKVDRDTASRFGITSELIDAVLYSAFGQSQVSTLYAPMNQYHVVMEVAPKYWQFPETLDQIYVLSPQGKEVPLSAFASFAPSQTLLSVNHQGLAPSATLSFNLIPGTALGDAVNNINETVKKMRLPPTLHGSFQGTALAFQQSLGNEVFLVLAALLVVYITLGILYESLIHPITILSTLPSAGVGALLALLISGQDLSLIALIGMILLIGIVKKNAIMMIDFALYAQRIERKLPEDAIFEAATLRFRPIMMTTMAALLGALPLVTGFGLGSELRRPLGIAIVGGLIVSQLLTLYTTPVIYLSMANIAALYRRFIQRFKPMGVTLIRGE